LNPQAEQRHTACMRYISAPQRSQIVWSAGSGRDEDALPVFGAGTGARAVLDEKGESGIGEIIAHA